MTQPAAVDAEEGESRIQRGIAFARGERPRRYWRLLLLNAAPGASRAAVHDALGAVETMLRDLGRGEVRDLVGQPRATAKQSAAQFQTLEHLIAFGRRIFDEAVHDPPLAVRPRPAHLAYLPAAGPFPSLSWTGEGANRGEADFALQFTADEVAAVNCAAVEVWKLVVDEGLPLEAVGSFDGFARRDRRGWLEFHDGVSNMISAQRRAAIEAPSDPEWMGGGTYMAFLRLFIDLAAWRRLTRAEQELLVGRDKLSGVGLVGTIRDASGRVVPVPGPAADGDTDARARSELIDPPQTVDPIIEASHVHRANQLRGSPLAAAALRIFRQGYEFFDDLAGEPRVGLNFVSFQRELGIINHLLHLGGWLGDVNFGGRVSGADGEPPALSLLSVDTGGYYAVPPVGKPFPGADLFG